VVANLEPATLMGIESNGMVLAGSSDAALALIALGPGSSAGRQGQVGVAASSGRDGSPRATDLYLFTLLVLTVWLPGHVA
jgi:tRNA-binding EMAP/Myf-like protein